MEAYITNPFVGFSGISRAETKDERFCDYGNIGIKKEDHQLFDYEQDKGVWRDKVSL